MIGVICESPKKFKEKLERYKKLNYTIANDRYEDAVEFGKPTTLDKQEWSTIYFKKNKVIIFLIDKGYPTTLSKLRKALNIGKQVIAIYNGERFDIPYLVYLDRGKEKFHQAYLDLRNTLKEDYQCTLDEREYNLKDARLELYKELDGELDMTIVEAFVRTFATEYDIVVDYNEVLDIVRAYHSLKFYLENDIEYAREHLPAWVNVTYLDNKGNIVESEINFEDPSPYSVGDLNMLENIAYTGHIKNA